MVSKKSKSVRESGEKQSGKTVGVKVATGVYAVQGILFLLLGLLMTLLGGVFAALVKNFVGSLAAGIITAIGIFVILVSIAYLAIAHYLWRLNKTAKLAATILSILGLFSFPIGTIIHGAVVYYLNFDEKTKDLFK